MPSRAALPRLLLACLALAPAAGRGAEAAGAGAGPAAEATDWAVQPGSTLGFSLVHTFHEVSGVSRAVEGKVRLLAAGRVQAMVRSRVDAFDSGNGNRDAHMLEVVEAGRYPQVVLKAAGALPAPAAGAATVALTLRGEVTFHGVTRPLEVPVTVTFETPRRAVASGRFTISLEGFGVERPSLLFVKVDDAVVITASLVLAAEQP
jgi:polyisoprenoid-binding protein YceI